jgi:hypothetical protein
MGLVDIVGDLIEDYEAEHHPLPDVSGVPALKFLMEQHGLKQSDLHEIGSQGVVSEDHLARWAVPRSKSQQGNLPRNLRLSPAATRPKRLLGSHDTNDGSRPLCSPIPVGRILSIEPDSGLNLIKPAHPRL